MNTYLTYTDMSFLSTHCSSNGLDTSSPINEISDEELSSASESTTDFTDDVDMEEMEELSGFLGSITSDASECLSAEGRDPFDEALYDGANISVFESYFLSFQFAVRHSLTIESFSELLQLISVHVPQSAKTARSVHSLKRYFLSLFPHATYRVHRYCTSCLGELRDGNSCSTDGCSCSTHGEFISIPLGPQIKHFCEGNFLYVNLHYLLLCLLSR